MRLLLLLVAVMMTGCAGTLVRRARRGAGRAGRRRRAYVSLVRAGGSPAETERADAELHGLERRVLAYEQGCAG